MWETIVLVRSIIFGLQAHIAINNDELLNVVFISMEIFIELILWVGNSLHSR